MNYFALDILLEETPHGLRYELPASLDAFRDAQLNHASIIVPVRLLRFQTPVKFCVDTVIVSRDVSELALDLLYAIERDAPGLFDTHRSSVYECDGEGQRLPQCHVPDCHNTRGKTHVMCPTHWRLVAPKLRIDIWQHYRRSPGSAAHIRAIQAAIDFVVGREVEARQ